MKKSIQSALCLTSVILTLFPLTTVRAEQNHFYLQADVGGTSARDVQLREFFGQPITANSEIKLDPGIRLGIRAGYGLTDWLAAEVETGISANNIDSITSASEANGSIANVPVLLNLRLQVPEKNRFAPYAGAGFGIASTILSGDQITIVHPGGSTILDGSVADGVFAYQAFAGLRFAINDRTGLSFEYRYFHTEKSNMSADIVVGPVPSDRVKLGRTESHMLSVSFDLRF
jgi:opacity protein-like surface antigen